MPKKGLNLTLGYFLQYFAHFILFLKPIFLGSKLSIKRLFKECIWHCQYLNLLLMNGDLSMSTVFKVLLFCTCLKNSYKMLHFYLFYKRIALFWSIVDGFWHMLFPSFFIAVSKRNRLPKSKHRVLMEKKRGSGVKGLDSVILRFKIRDLSQL